MDQLQRDAIEHRFQEVSRKLEDVRRTGQSPAPGVDAKFYRGQPPEELDEIEYELGDDYFEERGPGAS